MIIRQTPNNVDAYIAVDNETSNILHQHGFYPKYIDSNFIYYVRSSEIIDFILDKKLLTK